MKTNTVIAGDYKGWDIVGSFSLFSAEKFYLTNVLKKQEVSKATVTRYDVINQQNVGSFGRSFIYGAVGQTLFGPLGMVAGLMHGANGKQIFIISLELNNGKNALLQVDAKTYQKLVQVLY
jgi:hypothetical protein